MTAVLAVVGAVFVLLLLASAGIVEGEMCFADLGCVRSNEDGLTLARE